MKEIKEISNALKAGDMQRAFDIKKDMSLIDSNAKSEIDEIVRQAIISYLKKGKIHQAREAEILFCLSKDVVEETVKQAVLSSFRDGDMNTVIELKNGLPIPSSMAKELVDYAATWNKSNQLNSMRAVFA